MSVTASVLKGYVRVSADNPCGICGHDTWCLIAKDGKSVICPRVPSQRSRGELGYVHPYDGEPVKVHAEPPTPVPPVEITALAQQYHHAMTRERWSALSLEIGVSIRALQSIYAGWSGSAYSFPMFNGKGTCGIRFRGENGKKWSLKGGATGLFLPSHTPGGVGTLYVAEGPTDLAALTSWGLYAVGRPNATACRDLVIEYIHAICPRRVVIVSDNDASGDGLRGALKLQNDRSLRTPCRIVKPARRKDIRQVYCNGGDRRLLIDAAFGTSNKDWEVVT